jgi:hypothetical protein
MNLTKLSGSIFMVFVLISAPFFAIQTRQDGINRVLADEFQIRSSDIISANKVYYSLNTLNNDTQRYLYESGASIISSSSGTEYSSVKQIINNNSIILEEFNIVLIAYWNNNTYLGYYFNPNFPNDKTYWRNQTNYIADLNASNLNLFIPNNATHFSIFSYSPITKVQYLDSAPYYIDGTDIFISALDYYDIMENARLANYSDVDGFTNVFYQIPRMASSLAHAYNRFINWTENVNEFLNPFNTQLVENLQPDGWLINLATTLQKWIRGEEE